MLTWLRPAAVLGILFGGIATAGATWGVVQLATQQEERPPVVVQSSPKQNSQGVKQPREQQLTVPAEAVSEQSEPRMPAVPEKPAAVPHRSRTSRVAEPTKRSSPDPEQPASAKLSDSVLVHQAVKALRSAGDAEQAGELLERYRAKHPDGVLAEEALALSIEAALERGDPTAKRLAQEYLTRYPKGRFRGAARRAAR